MDLEIFLPFFTNRFLEIGEKILKPLSLNDLVNFMQASDDLRAFVVNNNVVHADFLNKALVALHKAVLQNDAKVVEGLCQWIPQPKLAMKDSYGHTPLQFAVERGFTEIVRILCSYMASEQVAVTYGHDERTLLHEAVSSDLVDVAIVDILCKKMSKDQVGITNKYGYTALVKVTRNRFNFKVLGRLEKQIVKILCQNMPQGLLVQELQWAAMYESEEIVKILCENMSAEQIACYDSNNDFNALSRAVLRGRVDVVKILYESMPKDQSGTEAKSKRGFTPLYHAVQTGKIDIVQALCKHIPMDHIGMVIDGSNCNLTLLQIAALHGQIDLVKFLCQHMSKEQFAIANNHNKTTALHCAALNGHVELVKILCDQMSKEQLSIQDSNGQTALQYAEIGGHHSVVEFLSKLSLKE